MKDASKTILNELAHRGYRITDARKDCVETLAVQKQPIAIQALARLVASDEASVYRTVALLVAEGFLEEISLQGEVPRYALLDSHAHTHHHHMVCTNCSFVAHVPCGFITLQEKMPQEFKKIFSHEVTLYGLCRKCA